MRYEIGIVEDKFIKQSASLKSVQYGSRKCARSFEETQAHLIFEVNMCSNFSFGTRMCYYR